MVRFGKTETPKEKFFAEKKKTIRIWMLMLII